MAMASRKRATAPDHDRVRTSLSLARPIHSRLCALASIRGCSINALIEEAVEQAVRGIVVMDRRKSADSGVPSAGVKDRPVAPVESDDSEGEADRQAA
jgi:hypothetical protein